MHHVTNILEVNAYQILCEFDKKENRVINFDEILSSTKNSFVQKLKDIEIFRKVKLDTVSKTLYWENLAQIKDYDGTIKTCELDFDPNVLYNNSKAIN